MSRASVSSSPGGGVAGAARRRLGLGLRPDDRLEAVRAVGQQHPVGAAAVLVVQRVGLAEHALPLGLGHHRDVGAGADQVVQQLAVQGLPEAEGRRLDVAEERGADQVVGRVGVLLLVAEHVAQPLHPGDPLVALVPHQRDLAARPQHPGDLRQRALEVEPVEGLRTDDDVDRAGGQRDLLRDRAGGRARPEAGRPGAGASPRAGPSRAPGGRAPPGRRSAGRCRRRAPGPAPGCRRRASGRPPAGSRDGPGRRRPPRTRTTGPWEVGGGGSVIAARLPTPPLEPAVASE